MNTNFYMNRTVTKGQLQELPDKMFCKYHKYFANNPLMIELETGNSIKTRFDKDLDYYSERQNFNDYIELLTLGIREEDESKVTLTMGDYTR